MPCYSFNLPASECKTGSKLAKIEGSVCNGCYALKGFYRMPVVKKSMYDRLALIKQDSFVYTMTNEITRKEKSGFFRWHDSGDLQSVEHLEKIVEICKRTPHIKHWLPTREKSILSKYKGDIPDNLTIRLSSSMVDVIQESTKYNTSTVHTTVKFGVECSAPSNNNKCGSCRKCWDKSIKNISYRKH